MFSLMCAGVSALMCETNVVGADIPFLIAIETGMFGHLINNLDTSISAGMLHAAKHMFSAKLVGGRALKWLNSACSVGGHIAAAPSTGGMGNAGITAYLRASNAALSAMLCEYMGWAFVNDYENGRMNVKDKLKEGLAFAIFNGLIYGFDNALDLEGMASSMDDKALKTMGMSIARNMSGDNAAFVSAAMKFLAQSPMTKAAKGIELVTPAIAKHLIENKGKLNNDFLEATIKGSIYSLVCSDLLGSIDDDEIIKEKAKKYILYMRNDPQIKGMIDYELVSRGIKVGTQCKVNKDTVKSLEALYNEITPKCVEIIKAARSI